MTKKIRIAVSVCLVLSGTPFVPASFGQGPVTGADVQDADKQKPVDSQATKPPMHESAPQAQARKPMVAPSAAQTQGPQPPAIIFEPPPVPGFMLRKPAKPLSLDEMKQQANEAAEKARRAKEARSTAEPLPGSGTETADKLR